MHDTALKESSKIYEKIIDEVKRVSERDFDVITQDLERMASNGEYEVVALFNTFMDMTDVKYSENKKLLKKIKQAGVPVESPSRMILMMITAIAVTNVLKERFNQDESL